MTVTVSSKFQIVIPRAIRESLGIPPPGMKLHPLECRGRLELVPVKSAKQARGFPKDLDTAIEREPERL